MKYITIYRSDFKESSEANFFEDILGQLKIPQKEWDTIASVELDVEDFVINH